MTQLLPPWRARALDPEVATKEIRVEEYVGVGLWIASLGAGVISMALAMSWRWWGAGGEPDQKGTTYDRVGVWSGRRGWTYGFDSRHRGEGKI
ncbi:MAG: hypothetical protein KDM63_14090, partial [Verrucomicrobiae bacterium]|nr:hypothetical protein [Verrucomicrobiae bacterium]